MNKDDTRTSSTTKLKTQHNEDKLYDYWKNHRLMNIFLYKAVFNWGKESLWGFETMMTELDKLKEFTICAGGWLATQRSEVRSYGVNWA